MKVFDKEIISVLIDYQNYLKKSILTRSEPRVKASTT